MILARCKVYRGTDKSIRDITSNGEFIDGCYSDKGIKEKFWWKKRYFLSRLGLKKCFPGNNRTIREERGDIEVIGIYSARLNGVIIQYWGSIARFHPEFFFLSPILFACTNFGGKPTKKSKFWAKKSLPHQYKLVDCRILARDFSYKTRHPIFTYVVTIELY